MDRIDIRLLQNGNIIIFDKKDNSKIEIDDEKKIKDFFNQLSNYVIKEKKYDNDSESLFIENTEGLFCIRNYLELREEDYFFKMQQAISKYNMKKAAHVKLVRNVVATTIATVGLTSAVLLASSIGKVGNKDKNNVESNIELPDYNYSGSINIDADDDIITDEEVFDNEEVVYIDESKIENVVNFNQEDDIDPLSYVQYDLSNENNKNYNVDAPIDIIPHESNTNISNIMPDLSEYDDVIKLASSVYDIDYETARKVVLKYQDVILSEKGNVSLYMPYNGIDNMIKSDTDRIKDLKEKGFIDPDLISSGIFLTISNYAYSIGNIGNNVRYCDLSREDREKYILYIASNVYGVKDENLKALLLAATWIESHTGTSEMGKNKNNIGGIKGSNGNFVIYNSFEQGACEYIYNMLKNVDRTMYNDDFNQSDNLFYKLGYIYCNETWQDWGREVSKEAAAVIESNKINNLEQKDSNLSR